MEQIERTDPIRVGDRWMNRFSGEMVTITSYREGKDVDYKKDNAVVIIETNLFMNRFTKPEHIFHRQYKKVK